MRRLFIFTLLFFILPLEADPPVPLWERVYGGHYDDEARGVIQVDSGRFVIVGWTSSYGADTKDAYLLVIDSLGDTLWTKTYGRERDDVGYDIAVTDSGDFILVGGSTRPYFEGYLMFSWVLKLNSEGDTLWEKVIKRWDSFKRISRVKEGGFLAVGVVFRMVGYRMDGDGDSLWFSNNDEPWSGANDFVELPGGGFMLVGLDSTRGTDSTNCEFHMGVSFFSDSGDFLYDRFYRASWNDALYSVVEGYDGNYLACGYTARGDYGMTDLYLVKLDSLGDTLWTRVYGGPGWECGYDIERTDDSAYIVVGYTDSRGSGWSDVYLLKVNDDGDTLWTATYGGSDYEGAYRILPLGGDNYLIVGYRMVIGGYRDVYILRLGPQSGVIERGDKGVLFSVDGGIGGPMRVEYGLEGRERVRLVIYDVLGREVRVLRDRVDQRGRYEVEWDIRDDGGLRVNSGVYIVGLTVGDERYVRRVIVLGGCR